MKYHFKKMLQHNTLNTQCLFKNICVKKYNLKNHKKEKKTKKYNKIIVNCKKPHQNVRAWYYLQLSQSFFFTIYEKELNKNRERFLTHIMAR